MDEIRELLDEAIKKELERIIKMDNGEEKTRAINDLVKFYQLRNEETKINYDFEENYKRLERDEELEKRNWIEKVKDRYFKAGIEILGIVLPLIFYAAWTRRGFKFEETGTFTSTTFRNLFSRFRPTK